MAVQIGARGQASFNEPIELLMDCHRRIESLLEVLVKVADPARGETLDEERRRALEAALKYFREAAPRHMADEEESLFPRMIKSDSAEVKAAAERLRELEADHVKAGALHDAVEVTGRLWLELGTLPGERLKRMREELVTLRELYRQHIAVEDGVVFPLAAKTLEPGELAAVGEEMKARRGK